ncbi:MAG: CHAT domain-containing protein [Cyanobacteria bacterium SBLK]|nr:CHAT domain-containing protein [Cyanobacteria bacterium SBLK]
MDEQRMQEYVHLIHQLLQCESGEKAIILQANSHLVDEGLLLTVRVFADKFQEDGQENLAQWLLNFANELQSHLRILHNITQLQDYLQFIQALLRSEGEEDKQKVQMLLRQNLNLLDLRFAEILTGIATHVIEEHPEIKDALINLIENVCIKINEFPLGNRANNLEIAIFGYQFVMQSRNEKSRLWAHTQNNIANAYLYRIKGNKGENLEKAIAAYQLALTIRTQQDFPVDFARIQNNLATAYLYRIKEDKGENLEKAIAFCNNALTIRTQQDFPVDFARTQNNLAIAYRNRIKGDKEENLEEALSALQLALTILTQQDFPVDWAMIQNNLATAYFARIKGDKTENLEKAITAYQLALTICTKADFPVQWAMTQNNLAAAYSNRIKGDKEENLEKAISALQLALTIYTQQDFPVDFARTQNNLAAAYSNRIKGDKTENLEKAIAAYQLVLTILTQQDFPVQWATTQNNLAAAYSDRIKGDKGENLEKAIAFYNNALTVRTLENFPLDHLQTERNRGNLYFKQENWKLAIEAYSNAVRAVEKSRLWATTDRRRKEIVKENIYVYKNLFQSYLNVGEIKKAIETAERSRCKQLIDLMESRNLHDDANIPPEVQDYLQQYDRLEMQIYTHQSALQTYNSKEPALTRQLRSETLQENARDIQQLQQEKQRLWEEIRRRDPVIAGQIQIDPLNFSQMQALIENEKTAILIFYSTDDDTHIFILYQTGEPAHFTCRGQGYNTLQKWLLDNWFVPYVTQFNQWKANMETVLREISQRLQLNELCTQHLQHLEELVIIPHLALHQIPFAALEINSELAADRANLGFKPKANSESPLKRTEIDAATDFHKGDRTRGIAELTAKATPKTNPNAYYLSDRFRLRTVPSCQILNYCHQGDAIAPNPHLGIVEDAKENLPFTRYECETLAQRYRVPETRRLQGKQATLDNYKTLLHQIHRLHTSHHAASNLNDPLASVLQLSDRELTLSQILTWRIPQLTEVFASACETHFTATELTDDLLTIATSFLCTGVRNVISTQWSVEDLASALLAIFYYKNRDEGKSPSHALQRARQQLRNLTGEELKNKYYYTLTAYLEQLGEPEKIESRKSRLSQLCKENLPFSSPYNWAGFISQGRV